MLVEEHIKKSDLKLVSCLPEIPVQMAAAMLTSNHIGAMPVLDTDKHLVGLVSERDILRCVAQIGAGIKRKTVGDIMTKQVITCARDSTILEARSVMLEHHIRHLVIAYGKHVLGMLSMRDLVKTQLEDSKTEMNVLRDSIVAARHH